MIAKRKKLSWVSLLIVSTTLPSIWYIHTSDVLSSMSLQPYGTVGYRPFTGKGVNYNENLWSISDAILQRDFSRFHNDGINVIDLNLYWNRLEGNTRGDYDGTYSDGTPYGDSFLENVKRTIKTANQYGLKVMLDFHTLWNQDGEEWMTPGYVIDSVTGKNTIHAILDSESLRQGFIDMVNNTVSYLKNESIWSWALLNEPWGKNDTGVYIDLIQKLSFVVKSIGTSALVTVRFVSDHSWNDTNGLWRMKNNFVDLWNWDQTIFNALDFVSFNIYYPLRCPQLYDTWINITKDNVNVVVQQGKRVWVTEFGADSDNDTTQAAIYEKTLEVFESLPIDGWMAWHWQQFYERGQGFNMLRDNGGDPRQAYNVLLRHNPDLFNVNPVSLGGH